MICPKCKKELTSENYFDPEWEDPRCSNCRSRINVSKKRITLDDKRRCCPSLKSGEITEDQLEYGCDDCHAPCICACEDDEGYDSPEDDDGYAPDK